MKISDSGYVLLDTYGVLAFPADMLPQLQRVIRLNKKYEDGSITYEHKTGEYPTFTLMPADDMHAIIAASKLESS